MKTILLFIILISPVFAEAKADEAIVFSKEKWEILEYSGIKPNKVDFKNQSLTIGVNQSAGPLVYRLKKPQVIKEIVIDAELLGALKLKKSQQGAKGNDDFSLRIGLVYQGKKRLGFIQRQIAANWIKKLFSLAPKNIGISHVEFFSVYQDKRLAKAKRTHPLSELLVENFVIERPKNGKLKTTIKVPSNKTTLALWISSDGDDTKSAFTVKLNKLTVRGVSM